jgi:hypothetical protein
MQKRETQMLVEKLQVIIKEKDTLLTNKNIMTTKNQNDLKK